MRCGGRFVSFRFVLVQVLRAPGQSPILGLVGLLTIEIKVWGWPWGIALVRRSWGGPMQFPAIYSLLRPIFPKTTLIGLCQKIHISSCTLTWINLPSCVNANMDIRIIQRFVLAWVEGDLISIVSFTCHLRPRTVKILGTQFRFEAHGRAHYACVAILDQGCCCAARYWLSVPPPSPYLLPFFFKMASRESADEINSSFDASLVQCLDKCKVNDKVRTYLKTCVDRDTGGCRAAR